MAPSAFIPYLEDNDLIDELSWIMLKKAAACCSRWRSEGLDASVSVNMSLKSLIDTELADRVINLVAAENLDPAHMLLELTETAVATDVGRALENMVRLRIRGFGLTTKAPATHRCNSSPASRFRS